MAAYASVHGTTGEIPMKPQKFLHKYRWSRPKAVEQIARIHKVKISRQSLDDYINGERPPQYDFVQAFFEWSDGEVGPKDWGLPRNYLDSR